MNDKQLIEFTAEFRAGILEGAASNGWCFAVCAPLEPLLRLHGISVEMIESDIKHLPYEWFSHHWLRLPDGRALDPTADQFGDYPPVYLGPPMTFHGERQPGWCD